MNKKIIHSVVEHTAIQVPGNVAIQEANRQLTYQELNNAANRLAYVLRDLGVERNVIVGVLLPSSIDLVVSLLAIFKSGGIYLPIDLSFPRKKLEKILQQCAPKVWITHTATWEEVKQLGKDLTIEYEYLLTVEEEGEVNVFKKGNEQKSRPVAQKLQTTIYDNLPITNTPDDGNYIFYTSGSTGEPKAILGCHKSLGHFIDWEIQEFQVGDTCRVSQLIQTTFDASLRDIFLPLCTGGTLVIPSAEVKSNTWKQIEWLDEQRITHVHYVPSLFRLIIKDLKQAGKQGEVFPAMRHFLLAGEMLYAKDVQQWREVVGEHVELVNLYGPTETTMVKTFSRIREVSSDPGQALVVGKPISHTWVAIINDGLACQVGEIGEIYLKTAFTTKGYLFDPVLHAKVFVQNPLVQDREDIVYKTGDLGRMLASGDLEVLGRADAQVKINGVRVEIGEIEKAVLNLTGMEEVVIILHTDEEQQASLVCYYTGVLQEVSSLNTALREELHLVAIPSHFVHLEAFPLTINGKIDKKALPKPELLLLSDGQYEAVANETEKKLEAIWKEVLNLSRIGRKASFFAIGGSSLKAIRVISRIYKELGVLLKVRDIFDYQTIEQLAKFLEKSFSRKAYEEIEVLEPQSSYELSHAQKRLWVLSRFDQAQSAYNIHGTYLFKGKLNREAFQQVFMALEERHEVLRTTFVTVDGEPRQKIHAPGELGFSVDFIDLREQPSGEEKAQSIVFEQAQLPFDLQKGPLMRVTLLQLENETHHFLFTLHHIIGDAWSIELLVNEVLSLYQTFTADLENTVPPLRIQYKEYAAWQNQQLSGENLQKHRNFWLEKLGGELPVLHLPTDYPRPVNRSFQGDWVATVLNQALTGQLNRLSQDKQASLFMTLLSAVNVLLYRYTGQEDIIVGTPVAGREHQDLENQIGFYINNLALRTHLNGQESFETLLESVKELTLQAFEHQVYPFDRLVDDLNLVRDTSRSPLLDVVVVLQNADIEDKNNSEWQGISVSSLDSGFRSSTVDLRIVFSEQAEGLAVMFEYNTDVFARKTTERMLKHFETLALAITQDSSLAIQDFDYLLVPEKQQVLVTFNETSLELDHRPCIQEIFEAKVAEQPEAIALVTASQEFTYREVNEEANRLAYYLRNQAGVQPNDLVGLMIDRSAQTIIAILAILKAGGAYVPIAPELPTQRKAQLLSDAKIDLLLTDSASIFEVTDYYAGQLFALDIQWSELESHPENLPNLNKATDLAYVIYTSGSTGQPKGVMIEHRSNVNMSLDQVRQFSVTAEDRVLQFAALSFDASVSEIFMAFYAGASLVLIEQPLIQDALGFTEYLEAKKVTVATLPPSYLSALPMAKLSGLNVLITAGEPANVADLIECSQFAKCFNAFGPTECAVCVTIYPVTEADQSKSFLPIGRPIANTKVYVLDTHLRPVAIGVEGEICVSGYGLARGYLHQPSLTSERFIDNPFEPGERLYRTGDIGKWLPDGNLAFIGRKDNQMKIHGYRIELGEIENALSRHEKIQDAVVMVREDEGKDKYLVAYYTSKEAESLPDLKPFLSQYLPNYMIPAHFVAQPSFPLTAHGKIDYPKLPNPVIAHERQTAYIAAQNSIQQSLVDVWEKVLGRAPIGIYDNFFELGGHSLKATQVLSLVQEAFSTRLDLGAFFITPTIAALAILIEQTKQTAGSELRPVQEQDYYNVSHAQRRLWVLHQLEDAQAAYNLPAAFILEGSVDRVAFCNAFIALVNRHEILRTTFSVIDGEPKQRIHPIETFGFEVVCTDLRECEQPLAVAESRLIDETAKQFDLQNGPLIRAHLLQLADEKYFFAFVIHHIIGDEWSMAIIVTEWLQYYEAYRKNENLELPSLSIQYKDFAAWQTEQLEEEAFVVHKNFWLKEFESSVPVLEMPTQLPRPELKTFRGGAANHSISPALSQALAVLGQSQEASLFMTLIATVYALLYRYTGQSDLVLGTPAALRNHKDLQNQVGLYLNTLALRTPMEEKDSFTSLLKRVRQKTVEVYAHQEYPFDLLVDDLALTRDLSRSPLFDVMVVLHNQEDEEKAMPQSEGLSIEPYPFESHTSKFDLSFHFRQTENGLQMNAEFNSDLFTQEGVERLLMHYDSLLREMLTQPEASISGLDYLSASERRQLLVNFNDTQAVYPTGQTLVTLFEAQVAKTPEATAIQFEDVRLSYQELNELSNRLAHYLRDQFNIVANDLVCLMLDRSERQMIVLLGILKSGAAYVPIDLTYPAERIRYIAEDTKAKCLIVDEIDRVTSLVLENIAVVSTQDWPLISQYPPSNPPILASDRDLAYVIYTSGSTGTPKGVMLEHRGVVNRLDWMWKQYNFTASDVIFQKTPYVFDVSVGELFMPLCFGASLVLCRPEVVYNPTELVNHIVGFGITSIHFVSSMLHVFLQSLTEEDLAKMKSLRLVLTSGEALLAETVRKFYQKIDLPLYNLYGPTEASIEVSHYLARSEDEVVPIGKPIANTQLYLLDNQGKLVPAGIWGEIAIGGIGLARGYLNKSALTSQKFVTLELGDGPAERLYLTGDMGRWLPTGDIEYKGRKDTQVKLRGQRIELGEIENTLLKLPAVQAVAVALKEDAKKEQSIVAYVVSVEAVETIQLRSHLARYLPTYMIPTIFIFLDRLPFTTNGKLDYKALPSPESLGLGRESAYQAPANEIEKQLSLIWQDVLGKSLISVDDNFFDVGGNSLRLIMIYQKMTPLFAELKVTDLFKYSTIRSISEFLAIEENASEIEGIEV